MLRSDPVLQLYPFLSSLVLAFTLSRQVRVRLWQHPPHAQRAWAKLSLAAYESSSRVVTSGPKGTITTCHKQIDWNTPMFLKRQFSIYANISRSTAPSQHAEVPQQETRTCCPITHLLKLYNSQNPCHFAASRRQHLSHIQTAPLSARHMTKTSRICPATAGAGRSRSTVVTT